MVEAVQRWRLAFRRGAPALELGPPEIARAWEAALADAGVPVMMSAAAKPRPRLTFAAALPPGRVAEHDLADFVLTERWSLPRLRSALAGAVADGFAIIDLFDVWLGAPSVTAALNAISHRATVSGANPAELEDAVRMLLASPRLERTRAKAAERRTTYDLRPLILELDTGAGAETVRMRLRASSDGPSGRPDEVILALGELLGRQLELVDLVRERLWTSDEDSTLRI